VLPCTIVCIYRSRSKGNVSSYRICLDNRLGRLGSIGALAGSALLYACKTTPLDVVYEVDAPAVADGGTNGAAGANGAAGSSSGGSGGVGGAAPVDPGHCSVVGPGRYVLRLRASGLCLGQGAPTTVFGNPGFLLNFDSDCGADARSWQLVATPIPNVFTFQNQQLPPPRYVLDVQMAAIRDGTPVITFGENGFDNQRFEVRARDAFASELRPQHHPQSCVGAAATGAQITTCDPTDSTQEWLLLQSACL
jgi:hypothetical protein